MRNADNQAYPMMGNHNTDIIEQGLTKRERFAMAAMQGILSNPEFHKDMNAVVREGGTAAYELTGASIKLADALLKELEETA